MQLFNEILEQRTQGAQRTYQELPTLRATADTLLREEKRLHVQGGWDAAPTLFFLREHVRSGWLRHVGFSMLTGLLHQSTVAPPEALARLAHTTELIRRRANGEYDPSWPAMLEPPLPWATGPGEDLYPCGCGYRFHGLGFTSIGTGRSLDGPGPMPLTVHHLYYVGRDGWAFEVWRTRATGGVPGGRYCVPSLPDGIDNTGGTVPESLTRLCNAIAANPVPVRRYAE